MSGLLTEYRKNVKYNPQELTKILYDVFYNRTVKGIELFENDPILKYNPNS